MRHHLLIAFGSLAALRVLVGEISNRRYRACSGVGQVAGYAHRGGAGNAPENTLVAFELGVGKGAAGLEMDVHLTRDGELVVIHDGEVDRTTDGRGRVCTMGLREVRLLDAGHRFEADGGHPYRGRDVKIPTFCEVLKRFPKSLVNVEIKADEPEAGISLLEALRRYDATGRTVVASVSHRKMRRFRRDAKRQAREWKAREGEAAGVATSASLFEVLVFYLASLVGFEVFVPVSYVALQVPVEYRGITVVTPRFLRAAHSRGLRVDVWTVDEAEEMHRLVALGVDGIMTDRPDILARVLAERRESGV
ncbi:MAG: glycerophosphodiester phosphodiesterase [Rubrobacter sp.]